MPEICPTPGRACPFDGEARERIAVLEADAKHSADTMTQMAADLRAIRVDLDQISRQFIAATSKVRGGWWMLIQVGAVFTALGGFGTWLAGRLISGGH
ncbi:hypothetical protein [Blastochloris tepida]|uniref:Uncharacterized protein n=1 Tax=Blastochloris tepida TaxID=2233851 RepID=A0A348G1G2_9HYPH|nr:hypothetical protein [Blastochloris tepida]BBF93395.1 hypothetical protein BLTE_20800 [Blastochloris tepida]